MYNEKFIDDLVKSVKNVIDTWCTTAEDGALTKMKKVYEQNINKSYNPWITDRKPTEKDAPLDCIFVYINGEPRLTYIGTYLYNEWEFPWQPMPKCLTIDPE